MNKQNIVDLVYTDKLSNEYLILMFLIIEFRKTNLLIRKPVKERTSEYVLTYKHHIVPRAWFKRAKLPIDNSNANLVFLTILEHLQVHILLKEYFKSINDLDMSFRMAIAIAEITKIDLKNVFNNINSLTQIDQALLDKINENDKQLSIANSYIHKKVWLLVTDEERKEFGNKVSEGLLNMPEDKRNEWISKLSIARKEYLSTLTDDLKKEQAQKRTISTAITRQNWTDELRLLNSTHLSESLHDFWDNADEEFLKQRSEICSEIAKNAWNNCTESERQTRIENSRNGLLEFWTNVTDEYRENNKQLHKDAWNNMTDEAKDNHAKKTSEGMKKAYDKMTAEQLLNLHNLAVERGKKRKGSVHVYKENPRDHKFVYANEAKNLVENYGYQYGNPSRKWKKEDMLVKNNSNHDII